ncbi:MAG: hypothetical protein OEW83_19730, partial [Acidimicrobiia bacterium]|nr:hypothetical protein [Acidimicrobiia bacterium]
MPAGVESSQELTIDRVVAHAKKTVPDRHDLEPLLRAYFIHVDEVDLQSRHVANLFGMAADHLRMVSSWEPGTVGIEVVNPR